MSNHRYTIEARMKVLVELFKMLSSVSATLNNALPNDEGHAEFTRIGAEHLNLYKLTLNKQLIEYMTGIKVPYGGEIIVSANMDNKTITFDIPTDWGNKAICELLVKKIMKMLMELGGEKDYKIKITRSSPIMLSEKKKKKKKNENVDEQEQEEQQCVNCNEEYCG